MVQQQQQLTLPPPWECVKGTWKLIVQKEPALFTTSISLPSPCTTKARRADRLVCLGFTRRRSRSRWSGFEGGCLLSERGSKAEERVDLVSPCHSDGAKGLGMGW
ncbi:hypothetical protein JRQ81_000911 [Phrynocephalus forsythii]|uniref:Uncharacterized protein n=1 Tax=Phrynocephalus forsythii TaxID=171643 RepID=A0A9Q0Y7H8_9SAUR|nr:hypothetical protein JRQ81_000911 [Phrynocephalus forsythii]